MKNQPWIGVDLDGTLAYYDRWQGVEHIGAPVPAMLKRVKRWLKDGKIVKIFTARVSDVDGETARKYITAWCKEHVGEVLEVTNVKDFAMLELWDDRAVQVEMNTGRALGRSTRGHHD